MFDSNDFKNNADVTKYMTIETQLSKKKGVMLMTYGYSGTGKTFTLFGSSGVNKKQGMLQSTLNNIRGLDEVRFRVLELYGLGVQYPYYWESKDIKQHIITYNLYINENNTIKIKDHNENENIKGILNDTETGFKSLQGNRVKEIFKNFDKFIDDIDHIRKKENRIRKTPNNPESSRSIVIYEFHLLIEGSYVPFIIIDLPGREEIVETFSDDYLSQNFIPEDKNTVFNRALLSSMSINPLTLSLLVPSVIFNTFNNLSTEVRKSITDTMLKFEIYNTQFDEIEGDDEYGGNEKSVMFSEENLGKIKKKPISLSRIYDFTTNGWKGMRQFKMINNEKGNKKQENIINIKGANDGESQLSGKNQVKTNINSIQYQAVLCLHLLNRLIILNKFDVMEKIYENIIEKYINMDEVMKNINKKEFYENYTGKQYTGENIDDLVDNIIKYKSFLAPFEGIYINESIVGLIKVLSRNVLNKSDEYIKKNLIKEQDKTLSFKFKKEEIRSNNRKLYKSEKKHDDINTVPYENIFIDNTILNNIIESNKSSYSSQKIFNYDNPSIQQIISAYMSERKIEDKKLQSVSDFKMFYLMTNTQMEKKCVHQLKLLENTISFINVINSSN